MKRRILAFLLGLFTVVICIEIALRIIGIVHLKNATTYNNDIRNSDYRILCIGDSLTFGIGASEGKDYPRQLEHILNSNLNKYSFAVVNRGVGSYNTSQILNNLPNWIEESAPNLVIILAGCANAWNYWGYQDYLEKGSIKIKPHDMLYRIRIFKLIKLIRNEITSTIFNDWIIKYLNNKIKKEPEQIDNYIKLGHMYKMMCDYTRSIEWFKKANAIRPDHPQLYSEIGNVYLRINASDKAIKWFKKGIDVDPSNSINYSGIGDVCNWLKKHDEAIEWFREGIRINPKDAANYTGIGYAYRDSGRSRKAIPWFLKAISINPKDISNYHGLAEAYNDTEEAAPYETLELLNQTVKQNSLAKEYIKMFENREQKGHEILKWMKVDLGKMIQLCKAKQIRVILQNYPVDTKQFTPFFELAERNSVLFVDHKKAFNKLWEQGEQKEKYFVPDGHCNDQGYAIMAKNIYDIIIKANLFK